ncbi:MAG: hypothetical protein GY928_25155 [Colwellia sp.]|nr:hypothetical protein [Colwellia sp.]
MSNIVNSSGVTWGSFDGEYLRNLEGKAIYRVDGDEVYTTDIPCKFIGNFNGSQFIELNGSIAFTVTS